MSTARILRAIHALPESEQWNLFARLGVKPKKAAAMSKAASLSPPFGPDANSAVAVSVITMSIVPCLFSAVEEWKWKRAQRLKTSVASQQTEEPSPA